MSMSPAICLVFQSMQRGADDVAALQEDTTSGTWRNFDRPGWPRLHFIEHRYAHDETNWWVPNRACAEAMLRSAGFAITEPSGARGLYLPARRGTRRRGCRLPGRGTPRMIEAAMIWNEPNNKSHWDPELDPDWTLFAELAKSAGRAIRSVHPTLPRILGGISPTIRAYRQHTGKGVRLTVAIFHCRGNFSVDAEHHRGINPATSTLWPFRSPGRARPSRLAGLPSNVNSPSLSRTLSGTGKVAALAASCP